MVVVSASFSPHLAAVSEKELTQNMLKYVLVERLEDGSSEARIVAADGYLMVVGRGDLEPGDEPGLVRADVWAEAQKIAAKMKLTDIRLLLKTETVNIGNGDIRPRYYSPSHADLKYVDWRRVLPARVPFNERTQQTMAIHPGRYFQAAKALGVDVKATHASLTVTVSKPTSPMLLETQRPHDNGVPKFPFAVLMPVMAETIVKGTDHLRWNS